MAAADREAILLNLSKIVDNAFDELACSHKALQRKVHDSISCLFEQHHDPSLPKVEAIPRRPEAILPFPAQHWLVLQAPQSPGDATNGVGDSKVADPSNGVMQQLERAVVASKCGESSSCKGDQCNNDGPLGSSECLPSKSSSPRGASVPSKLLKKAVSFGDDVSANQVKKIDPAKFCTHGSATSWISSDSEQSQCIFLRCKGRFTNVTHISDLPRWVRLAELILHSDSSRTSQLHAVWAHVLRGEGLRIEHIISQVISSSKMVLRFESTYRRVHRNSLLSHSSNHSLYSLGALPGCVADVCQRARRSCRLAALALPLHPGSVPRLIWDSICVAICIYDLVFLPTAVFSFDEATQAVKDAMDLIGAIFWTLDIVCSFCTAYFDGYTIQRSWRKICIAYIRTWFWMDLAIVLNDWVFVLASKGSFGAPRLMKVLKTTLRCVRLLRLKKVSAHYRMALQTVNSEILLAVLKIVTQTLIVVIICHYVACGWFALQDIGGSESTWVHKYIPPGATNSYKYCTCLHWALTQLLPASINVQPVNTPERVYTICVIIVSMVMFSSFISSISVSMNHLRSCRIAAIERDGQLRRFLAQYEISKELSHAIWGFMQAMRRARARADIKPGDVLALKNFPEHMLERVYEESYLRELQVHPLFEFFSTIEPQCMTKLCRTGLEQLYLLSREVLWHDLVVNGMLFVKRGTLIYDEAAINETTIVEAGGWCCEEALWGNKPRIDAPFSAGALGCQLLMVNPEIFRNVAKSFLENAISIAFLARYGEEFIRRFNQASHDCSSTGLLFNDKGSFIGLLRHISESFQISTDLQSQAISEEGI